MPWQIGERVGDYQIIEILGAGGMGQVYKVRNAISERVEAMKVLLPNLENNAELADRFMREIKVQASLDHPNIAALHTAQRIGNQLVMVMEFVEGQTIESLLRSGPLPLQQAISYTQQVLSALSFAHARGVVHRDIKPPNIMLTPGGIVKLMDFGIAKLAADPKLTQTGHTVGSLYYMSPEQINGAALDPRSDLYSLGVTLYEMVTGQRPFKGDSDYSIMSAHLVAKPVPPIQVDPRLPDTLNEIIMMAIAKDPAQRFQSADAFRAALGNVAAGVGVGPVAMGAGVPLVGAGPGVSPAQPSPSGGDHATAAPLNIPAQAAATPPPAAVAAEATRSRRGLYMAAGSLATVAVIIAAAIEAPKFFKPSGASPQVQQAAPAPVVTPPVPTQEAPPPAAVQTPQTTTPTDVAPVAKPSPSPESRRSAMGQAVNSPVQRGTPPANAPATQQLPTQQPVNTAPPPVAQAPPVETARPQPAASASDISELREQLMLLSTRASAAQQTIRGMQAQQGRSGMGMRQDITAGMDRMVAYLTEAEGSLRAGDAAKGKRYLGSAERELEKLEKFLGR